MRYRCLPLLCRKQLPNLIVKVSDVFILLAKPKAMATPEWPKKAAAPPIAIGV